MVEITESNDETTDEDEGEDEEDDRSSNGEPEASRGVHHIANEEDGMNDEDGSLLLLQEALFQEEQAAIGDSGDL